jgi:hypothetical protein
VKIYISGKIGNLPDRNIPKFEEAERLIRALGYEPVNPHKLDHSGHGKTWEEYMHVDLAALKECDAIYVLDDWKDSPGAKVEVRMALQDGLMFFDYELFSLVHEQHPLFFDFSPR